jgi:hypothetical protein
MALERAARARAWKVGISVAGAAAVLALFWANSSRFALDGGASIRELTPELAASLDREVDSVLARCNIERGWIKKSSVPIPNSRTELIERKVAIPADVLPVYVNVAMNLMAKRYNAKVIAYENMKDNTVTLHIEFNGTTVQKIILKATNALQRRENKHVARKT